MDIDVWIFEALEDGPKTDHELSVLLGEDQDRVRGAMERLREVGSVSRTQSGSWASRDPRTVRGRPRPAHTVALDATISELIKEDPRTAVQLAELTGASLSRVYLSLNRLRKEGRAFLLGGKNPNRKWTDPRVTYARLDTPSK